ncbi:MAG: transketolase [Actinomycetales bacterium]|nr:transketolase [Actinomycetales bacterium]
MTTTEAGVTGRGWRTAEDERVVAHARVLPLDVVQAKGSGHAGTAVSLTPALYVLFQEFLRHDPADPAWPGRDRFVLSAGHASLALYVQLYLSGYGLEMDDLRRTRTFGSRTPGHPEHGVTPGVETSTGPLGQGLGHAVGMAMAARRVRALLDPDAAPDQSPFDVRVWCLASDGDLQEGVSHEVAALAGRQRLDRLVVLWDDNRISIEGGTDLATAEDTAARFAAYGWRVLEIADAEDAAEVRAVLAEATRPAGAPTFVRLRTRIGHPMPHVGGTAAAHAGAPGAEEVAATKALLGVPDEPFTMPDDLLAHARRVGERGAAARAAWTERLAAWRTAHPDRAALLDRLEAGALPDGWERALPAFEAGASVATRVASATVVAALAGVLPELWGGSADLAESTGLAVPGWSDALPENPEGRQVHFGIREHGMAAVLTGAALFGLTRAVGSTYFVFSDYLRPALRLAALMRLPVTLVLTHDSLAVGEDGPTHQPVEHLWSLRAVPGLDVVRPADARETVAAWRVLLERGRPAALVLSRQGLPVLDVPDDAVLAGVRRGAWVVADDPTPDVVLLATGSEVALALAARAELAGRGVAARVVSAPCLEWFAEQDAAYRDAVLPPGLRARVAVEAGVDQGWYRYVGLDGRVVGVTDFGLSGAGDAVLAARGIHRDAVVEAALACLGRA